MKKYIITGLGALLLTFLTLTDVIADYNNNQDEYSSSEEDSTISTKNINIEKMMSNDYLNRYKQVFNKDINDNTANTVVDFDVTELTGSTAVYGDNFELEFVLDSKGATLPTGYIDIVDENDNIISNTKTQLPNWNNKITFEIMTRFDWGEIGENTVYVRYREDEDSTNISVKKEITLIMEQLAIKGDIGSHFIEYTGSKFFENMSVHITNIAGLSDKVSLIITAEIESSDVRAEPYPFSVKSYELTGDDAKYYKVVDTENNLKGSITITKYYPLFSMNLYQNQCTYGDDLNFTVMIDPPFPNMYGNPVLDGDFVIKSDTTTLVSHKLVFNEEIYFTIDTKDKLMTPDETHFTFYYKGDNNITSINNTVYLYVDKKQITNYATEKSFDGTSSFSDVFATSKDIFEGDEVFLSLTGTTNSSEIGVHDFTYIDNISIFGDDYCYYQLVQDLDSITAKGTIYDSGLGFEAKNLEITNNTYGDNLSVKFTLDNKGEPYKEEGIVVLQNNTNRYLTTGQPLKWNSPLTFNIDTTKKLLNAGENKVKVKILGNDAILKNEEIITIDLNTKNITSASIAEFNYDSHYSAAYLYNSGGKYLVGYIPTTNLVGVIDGDDVNMTANGYVSTNSLGKHSIELIDCHLDGKDSHYYNTDSISSLSGFVTLFDEDPSSLHLQTTNGLPSGSYIPGSTINISAIVGPNQVFKKWISDDGTIADPLSRNTTITFPSSSPLQIHLLAVLADLYTITFDSNGGHLSTTTMITDEEGKLASLPTPTKKGDKFIKWINSSNETVTTNTIFKYNSTIKAVYESDETVTPPTPDPNPNPSIVSTPSPTAFPKTPLLKGLDPTPKPTSNTEIEQKPDNISTPSPTEESTIKEPKDQKETTLANKDGFRFPWWLLLLLLLIIISITYKLYKNNKDNNLNQTK